MIQVDFYVLPGSDLDSRYLFLEKLATRALTAGLQIFIWLDNEQDAQYLQTRLWRAEPELFLPSKIAQDTFEAPIQLGWQNEHIPTNPDMLINLSSHTPPDAGFSRIAEIVIQQPAILEVTRARFQAYKDQGVNPSLHDMRKLV